ncbi:hypothetical protein IPC234_27300 [Pseudomonas aeruginosa]|nr:hypothetical protein IPC234_27300 [Pseudomonas aeruginosa]
MIMIDDTTPIDPSHAIREWLDVDNPVQHKWAIAHLQRKGEVIQRKYQSDFKNLLDWGYTLRRSAKNELLIRKMKDAWRQKAYRDRQDSKKPCTLVLSIEAKEMLDQLAELNGMSISQTVEKLIRREGNRRLKTGELTRDVTNLTTSQIVEQVSKNFRKIFDTPQSSKAR